MFQSWDLSKQVALCLQSSVCLLFRVENSHFETIVLSKRPPQNARSNRWCSVHCKYSWVILQLVMWIGSRQDPGLDFLYHMFSIKLSPTGCILGWRFIMGRVFTAKSLHKSEQTKFLNTYIETQKYILVHIS